MNGEARRRGSVSGAGAGARRRGDGGAAQGCILRGAGLGHGPRVCPTPSRPTPYARPELVTDEF